MFYVRPPLPKGAVLEKDGDERGTWIYSKFLTYPQKYGEFDPGSG